MRLMRKFQPWLSKEIFWLILILFNVLISISCFPIGIQDLNGNLHKNEKRYPNGTILGRYSYKDNEGNPVEVNYYADDSSYGVELKSVKVLTSASEHPAIQSIKPSIGDDLHPSTESVLYNPYNIKHKTNYPLNTLNKENKNNLFETSPDYEIYVHNEMETPKKCGKDKVRVYLDKEKRKIREASYSLDEAAKVCSQF